MQSQKSLYRWRMYQDYWVEMFNYLAIQNLLPRTIHYSWLFGLKSHLQIPFTGTYLLNAIQGIIAVFFLNQSFPPDQCQPRRPFLTQLHYYISNVIGNFPSQNHMPLFLLWNVETYMFTYLTYIYLLMCNSQYEWHYFSIFNSLGAHVINLYNELKL